MYSIRLATPDDKKAVAALIVLALDDLALKFVNGTSSSEALPVFELFFQQKGNLYSYENTLVCEDHQGVVGSVTGYNGDIFLALRQPVVDYLRSNYNFDSKLEEETSGGEFYLDSIGVFPDKQGQGIGTTLLNAFVEHARKSGAERVGLLVDKNNPAARKLYEKVGFECVGMKRLLGGEYSHLVFEIRH